MGQKVNPNGFRYGITKEHNTIWYADKKNFAKLLLEDQKIYQYLEQFTREYEIGNMNIKRFQDGKVILYIHTAKPGAVLVKDIQKFTRKKKLDLTIEVVTNKKPALSAKLLAEEIAIKLENRGSFRNAQKQAIRDAMKAGAVGIKTKVSGRLNGVDMARSEGYSEGEMKLHTLRQNVDYATATARTTYGAIGVKVWLSLGDVKEGK